MLTTMQAIKARLFIIGDNPAAKGNNTSIQGTAGRKNSH
jgi:hypothetical protein